MYILQMRAKGGQDNLYPCASLVPSVTRPGVLTGAGMSIRLLRWGQSRGLWPLGLRLKYQVTSKLEPRAPKVSLPRVRVGEK